jgi:bifunctional non-homologous end joining protein LigD
VSLRKYQSKRHFSRTPEPQGAVQPVSGPLRFVVQKHHATNLHYDLRLEVDGTLKSWAVPKGVSLNPEEKRLAVMVEDHPLDYAGFEGIIPKGNYGAGPVMVWDEGTYHAPEFFGRNETESLIRAGLAEGKFHVVLHGKKLRGEFIFFKLKDATDNSWILVKKQDAFASDQPISDDDRSVLTGRTMAEIASGKTTAEARDNGDDLSAAPRAPMPTNIKPMLAHPAEKPFDHPDWLFELKWDGFRAVAEVDRKQVRLYSRNQLSLAERFPAIVASLQHLGHEAVLDGEIVVLDERGDPQFQLLQNYQNARKGHCVYYVFDLLYLDGHDLRNLPLVRRKELLARIIQNLPCIKLSEHIRENGRAFFEVVAQRHLEGLVAKLASSRYLPGQRSRTWLKLKTAMCQEGIICGFTEQRGDPRNLGALILGVYEENELTHIGHVGSGFDRQTRDELRDRLEPLIQKNCPFKQRPQGPHGKTHWVRPELVCEVSFAAWTDDGHMKFPVFVRLREDKGPLEVHRESCDRADAESANEPETAPSTPARQTSQQVVPPGGLLIDGHVVNVTNLKKIYWPDEGYTKGDLIDYYRAVARFIVPHLRDRPESLNRHPNGILGKSFFQKDMSKQPPPEWMQTVLVPGEPGEKPTRTALCQDEASLVYLANLGCIELNPWHARIGSLELADYAMLDLDPEDTPFAQVTEVAQAVHKLLDQIGAASYCKTSGKRGLHVYIPFGARYTHEQAKSFAHLIAQVVHQRLPAITSLARDPAQRQQRVYLDFLQNGKGKTLAAAYCVRPYPGATVSTPLKWTEVSRRLDPSRCTIRTIPRRLDKVGDLWEPVGGPGIDLEGCLERMRSLLLTG